MEQDGISYENTKRMRSRLNKVGATMSVMAQYQQSFNGGGGHPFSELVKMQNSRLNKDIYELAEKKGVTVYDICLNVVPEYSEPHIKHDENGVTLEQEVRLVPMPFEYEKGPGYWKSKYYRLKEHLRELIDNKED